MDKDRLFELASDFDSALSEMNLVASSMEVLGDVFESEGFQYEDQFDNAKAIIFAKRFHLFYDVFNLARMHMSVAMEKMEGINDMMYEEAI